MRIYLSQKATCFKSKVNLNEPTFSRSYIRIFIHVCCLVIRTRRGESNLKKASRSLFEKVLCTRGKEVAVVGCDWLTDWVTVFLYGEEEKKRIKKKVAFRRRSSHNERNLRGDTFLLIFETCLERNACRRRKSNSLPRESLSVQIKKNWETQPNHHNFPSTGGKLITNTFVCALLKIW